MRITFSFDYDPEEKTDQPHIIEYYDCTLSCAMIVHLMNFGGVCSLLSMLQIMHLTEVLWWYNLLEMSENNRAVHAVDKNYYPRWGTIIL